MNKNTKFIKRIQKEAAFALQYYRPEFDHDPESYNNSVRSSELDKNRRIGYRYTSQKFFNITMNNMDWLENWRSSKYRVYTVWPGHIKPPELKKDVQITDKNVEEHTNNDYAQGWFFLKKRWLLLHTLIDPYYADDFSDNTFGNPTQFNFREGKITTVHISLFLMYLGLISKFSHINRSNRNERFLIIEIGAGYGGLARAFKTYFPNSTYVIIDLPVQLYLEQYYLSKSFPSAKIANSYVIEHAHPNITSLNEITHQYDFILIPPKFIEKFSNKTVNLFINTNSIPEMDLHQINYYYSQIRRLCCGYFFQHNRKTHKIQPEITKDYFSKCFNLSQDESMQIWNNLLANNIIELSGKLNMKLSTQDIQSIKITLDGDFKDITTHIKTIIKKEYQKHKFNFEDWPIKDWETYYQGNPYNYPEFVTLLSKTPNFL